MPTNSSNEKVSILKTTREAKGLTLDIVHEATKIPLDALKAIEEGYSVRILSPFYYRGFIKIYAEFLGLDVKEMYVQYGLDQAAPKPAPTSTVSTPKPSKTIPVKQSRKIAPPPPPNVILEQMQGGVSTFLNPKTFKLIFKIIAFVLVVFLLVKTVGYLALFFHRSGLTSRKQSVVFTQDNSISRHEGSMHHDSVQAPSEDNRVEVAVRASRDIWLLVKADGQVVYETTLSKGSMENWTADKKIELSGRDIEWLDMEVNNKQIGFLGGGDRRIRKVLITQEGLTVKK